jgi:dCTP deaminase
MALSDKKILAEMKTGNIIIEPFVDKNLGTSSYDLTLGEWFTAKPMWHVIGP